MRNDGYNLYEAIAVGAAEAIEAGFDITNRNVVTWIDDAELTKLTSGATNSKPRVFSRINYCCERFKGNV